VLEVQVAAYAERHILVEKSMHDERPRTGFRVLETREERVAEVADMLGLDTDVAEGMLNSAECQC
jgi:DNA repair ATPase RecN